MALKDKLQILYTGPRTYAEKKAVLEGWRQSGHVDTKIVQVTNGTSKTEDKQKNKIANINCDKDKIIPDELVTYTVKLDEKEPSKLKTEIKQVKFCLWFKSKDKNGKIKKIEIDKKITPAGVILVRKCNKAPRVTNIFEPRKDKGETLTANLDSAYYYANITYTENEAKLEIKYSKWMDGCYIHVEAYFNNILQDGLATTAPRWVNAHPEILDAYWMNAEGKKITKTGYHQELYVYLKTLGLKGKTIEVQVHEDDYYTAPSLPKQFPLSNNIKGNELIEWKNNQIKIDNNGEALKQFKVGNKKRYETAQKDESQDDYQQWYDQQINQGHYFVSLDPTEKYNTDLELYIHIPQKGNVKLGKDNQFAKLTLTETASISNAFFAAAEKNKKDKPKIQADKTPSKKNKNPKTSVDQYTQINKGVLGQTIRLVAECPNLEGKTVAFKVFEKVPLLEDQDKALTLIHEDQEKTRIEAKVENGYAVAELKLQHCKEDADNTDWEITLDPDNSKMKTAELYLKVEATENVFKVLNNGVFLDDKPFKFVAAVSIYKIYQKGKITKLHVEGAKKGRYYYYDNLNKEHFLGKYNYKKITNNYFWNKKYGSTKKINLVNLKDVNNYSNGEVKFGLTMDSTRPYANEFTLASLLGAMLECGFDDFVCNGFSKKDGSSGVSKSHKNGYHGDFKYLRIDKAIKTGVGTSLDISTEPEKLDTSRQNSFNNALIKFGWTKFLGWTYTINGVKHKLNHIPKNTTNHNHHLHIEIYNHDFIKVSYE